MPGKTPDCLWRINKIMNENNLIPFSEPEQSIQPESSPTPEPSEVGQNEPKPALVINVHSWWTPIAAIVALIVGLLVGYYGRPLIVTNQTSQPTPVASASPVAEVEPTIDPTESAARRQQIMSFLLENIKHFKGDPASPVTMVEFSDFQ